ncbi:MAG: hypothetical protein LLG04_13725 [Parachlamydia sp.]|nr:hypothetical protein [Parachlamydia sp.]
MTEYDLSGFDEADYFDWHDHDALEKLNEQHSRKWLKIYKKMMDARDKGDEKALAKAREEMQKHEEKGRKYQKKANATGFYWI